jgi:CarD family transcriptional regulator
VYPHHGAAVVERVELRLDNGEEVPYLVLRLSFGDLTVSVPVAKAEAVGVRAPVSRDEVNDIFDVMSRRDARMPTNWSRRFKNHVEKLKSGDVYQVAEVVRNLSLRSQDNGLSSGEKAMLLNARRVLVSELKVSLEEDADAVEKRLDAVLTLAPPVS